MHLCVSEASPASCMIYKGYFWDTLYIQNRYSRISFAPQPPRMHDRNTIAVKKYNSCIDHQK